MMFTPYAVYRSGLGLKLPLDRRGDPTSSESPSTPLTPPNTSAHSRSSSSSSSNNSSIVLTTMHFFSLTLLVTALATAVLSQTNTTASSTPGNPPYFNITAVTGQNNRSVFQCWQYTTMTSSKALPASHNATSAAESPSPLSAMRLPLGNLSAALYQVLPPYSTVGRHNAPTYQYVVVLSGVAHLTLPDVPVTPTTEFWLYGGKYGLILAADVAGTSSLGHITDFPSVTDTVTLQLPIHGDLPAHRVLYDGPCRTRELIGV